MIFRLEQATDGQLLDIIAGCQEVLASRAEKLVKSKPNFDLSSQEAIEAFRKEIIKLDTGTLEIAIRELEKVGPQGTEFYMTKISYIKAEIITRKNNNGERPFVRKKVRRSL